MPVKPEHKEAAKKIASKAAAGAVGKRVLQRGGFALVGYGVAAYAGLHLLRHFGIFEKQADQGIKIIEKGVKSVFSI